MPEGMGTNRVKLEFLQQNKALPFVKQQPPMQLTLLVLDLGLDVLDGVRRLDLKGDGLAGQGLDEDLHCGFVGQCSDLGKFDATFCLEKRAHGDIREQGMGERRTVARIRLASRQLTRP